MNSIAWTDLDRTMASVPRTRGYRFALLERSEVAALTDSLGAWFPEISVGTASCFLREEFLHNAVHFRDGPERDLLVVLAKTGREIAGMFSCERDRSALSLYARLGVVAPAHRGRGLIHSFVWLAEAIGRAAGIEMIYGMATLKIPHVQRTFEKRRWRLIGITPGYDREMVAPGVVKRVYEAVYAKVLVAEQRLLRPDARNLTARTRAFFQHLFPRIAARRRKSDG